MIALEQPTSGGSYVRVMGSEWPAVDEYGSTASGAFRYGLCLLSCCPRSAFGSVRKREAL